MRLDKFISNNSKYSRSEVKKFIKKGILINGKLIKDAKYDVNLDNDMVIFEGIEFKHIENIYIMLNKPQGYVSATRDARDKTVLDLLSDEDKIKNIFPVGRLDKDTEGLIFLTNDGHLSHKLISPQKNIFKKYYVEVDGELNEEEVKLFESGVIIDKDYMCKPAILEIIEAKKMKSSAYIQISEGKFHQIKKMMKVAGMNVIYLKRLSIGKLKLDDNLKLGEYRYLNDEEVKELI
ncbi:MULTISPECIES: pseudouridine synthase [unclassified Gemella]|uniref:pseudouridine synthase n=1 Tax=unclassified Gemella TaxID=2624949 RepID=UPI0015D01C98|nr:MULTISPECIES: pseudouridine synthase [unclassified Gemella]MBF0710825.1 rRNA pseudouridine synthase [Gemella sp. GL1.1]NYS28169.1 rRNA pseudouridine synthase [Gemella sp. GL1]